MKCKKAAISFNSLQMDSAEPLSSIEDEACIDDSDFGEEEEENYSPQYKSLTKKRSR